MHICLWINSLFLLRFTILFSNIMKQNISITSLTEVSGFRFKFVIDILLIKTLQESLPLDPKFTGTTLM